MQVLQQQILVDSKSSQSCLSQAYTDLVKALLSRQIWNMSSKMRMSSLFTRHAYRYLLSPLDLLFNVFSFSPPKYNKYCGKVKVRKRWIL